MDRRTDQVTTANHVAEAITRAGETPTSVSLATGISLSNLNDALSGVADFTVDELGSVGGFLHVHPALLIGAAA